MITARALHFVLKIGERKLTTKFYREILGMKVLRHEEFAEGCEATCNGPYANRWSKTMIGYGPEDSHFVIELTYNYGVNHYETGNDFKGITIQSKEVIDRAKKYDWPIKMEDEKYILEAPGGYKYYIINTPQPKDEDPVKKVAISSSNLKKSIEFWNQTLEMTLVEEKQYTAILEYGKNQTKLELIDIGTGVNHAKAYGRIAFALPKVQQEIIRQKIIDSKNKILTDLITLDTPGKASVTVIILSDPDNHEICFVDEEGFQQLSVPDYESEKILDRYINIEEKKKS